jgi:hypothetical protein
MDGQPITTQKIYIYILNVYLLSHYYNANIDVFDYRKLNGDVGQAFRFSLYSFFNDLNVKKETASWRFLYKTIYLK